MTDRRLVRPAACSAIYGHISSGGGREGGKARGMCQSIMDREREKRDTATAHSHTRRRECREWRTHTQTQCTPFVCHAVL